MKIQALVLLAGLALAPSAALAAERSVTLSVPGMFCPSCPYIVRAAIEKVDGVASVKTDLANHTAVVVFDDTVASVAAITAASRKAGYEADPVDGGSRS